MVTPAPSLPKDFSQLSLAEAAELLAARKLPPVEEWHPERTGDSAMEIRADGSWYHEGGRINRPAMVRLFSTILRREADGSHVLVTPAEKLAIAVEDTPFRAVEMKSEGEGEARQLVFRLDTDDLVIERALSLGERLMLSEKLRDALGQDDARIRAVSEGDQHRGVAQGRRAEIGLVLAGVGEQTAQRIAQFFGEHQAPTSGKRAPFDHIAGGSAPSASAISTIS